MVFYSGTIKPKHEVGKEKQISSGSSSEESLSSAGGCRPLIRNPWFYFVLLLFFSSMSGVIILLGTDLYDLAILKTLTLEKDGLVYNLWRKPDMETTINIYPFNYTNIDRIKTEKLNVQELGPYVFKEKLHKVNIVFNNNGTVTYSENRTHRYDPDESVGKLEDLFYTPNVPFMSAAAKGAERGMITQLALSAFLTGLDTRPFLPVTVLDFVEGFDDSFSLFARKITSILKDSAPPKFGMLSDRIGSSKDRITIGTGIPDLDSFGIVSSYNGKSVLNYWEDGECNTMEGSDGTFFPGRIVQKKTKVYLYAPKFCRRVPLVYSGINKEINDFPTTRFHLPHNIFSTPDENSENACFYADNKRQPSGTFSTSKCSYGAPVSVSYPHFLHGVEELRINVTGLNPKLEEHEFYMDLHSTFGLPIGGRMRFQINVVVHHCPFLSELRDIPEGTVLPIAWVDIVIGRLSGYGKDVVYHATYTFYYLKQCALWTSMVVMMLTLLWISRYLFKTKQNTEKH